MDVTLDEPLPQTQEEFTAYTLAEFQREFGPDDAEPMRKRIGKEIIRILDNQPADELIPGDRPDSSFGARLVALYGNPMRRALIRARHRYDAARPHRARMRRLHTAYGRRRR